MFEDKVVVVTGGASGIGRAVAERFATDGARVVIGDIQRDLGQSVAEQLNARFVHVDLSLRGDCQKLISEATDSFGTVHILVNNAGFQHIESISRFSEDTWDRMMAVMLTAPFLLTRSAWMPMKAQRWGRIINIASIHAAVASPYKVGYVTVKHALIGLTRTTALEGGPLGITAHALCPAYVRTPLVEGQIVSQAQNRGISESEVIETVMLARAAIKRLIEPHEVANLVAFLCGPEASAMTGAPVSIDLGWTAG